MGRVTQRRKVHRFVLDGSPAGPGIPGPAPGGRARRGGTAGDPARAACRFSVTMRTPGDDFDLVAGFLVSEGVIWAPDQLVSLRFCAGEDENGVQTFNVVEAQLRPDVPLPDTGPERLHVQLLRHLRHGLHRGRAQVLALQPRRGPADRSGETLASLPDQLRAAQAVFE